MWPTTSLFLLPSVIATTHAIFVFRRYLRSSISIYVHTMISRPSLSSLLYIPKYCHTGARWSCILYLLENLNNYKFLNKWKWWRCYDLKVIHNTVPMSSSTDIQPLLCAPIDACHMLYTVSSGVSRFWARWRSSTPISSSMWASLPLYELNQSVRKRCSPSVQIDEKLTFPVGMG